jgi:hypothetical protein
MPWGKVAKVKIRELVAQNFRPFYGRQTIDLHIEKARPISESIEAEAQTRTYRNTHAST